MNYTLKYSYAKVPTIRRFAECDKRWRGIVGPFGSGKSSGCIMEIIRRAQAQRPSTKDGIRKTRWAIIRNTYVQLRDTTIKTVLEWLPESVFGQFKVSTHDYIITGIQGCYIELLFRALDKPEHVSNLLSLELTGAWVNEAREVPKEIIDALDGRIGRYPSVREGGPTWYGIIMDTNPPDEDSWWYKVFEEDKPPHTAVFHQPSGLSEDAENLLTWEEWERLQQGEELEVGGVRPDYYIRLAEGKGSDFVNVYIHGKYGVVKEGKPVYEDDFNSDLHIAKEELRPIRGGELVVGMDFGLNPAAVITQLSPRGRFLVLDELVSESMGIEHFVDILLRPLLSSKYRDFKVIIIGDPAGAQRSQTDEKTCFDVLRLKGFKVRPAKSNGITYRLSSVRYFLSRLVDTQPVFQINAHCKKLIKGFVAKYCYGRARGGGWSETIQKNSYSHPHDALQYAASYFYEEINKRSKLPRGALRRQRFPASSVAGY